MQRRSFSGKRPDPGFPCYWCAVRPDVDCKHRPADPSWSMGPEPPDEDGRRKSSENYHRRRIDQSGILRGR